MEAGCPSLHESLYSLASPGFDDVVVCLKKGWFAYQTLLSIVAAILSLKYLISPDCFRHA